MSDQTVDNFLDEQFNDPETKAFFEQGGENESSDGNDQPDAQSLSEVENDTSEKPVSKSSDDITDDSQNEEEPIGQEETPDKGLNEQERFKAMAAEERNRRREIQKQIDQITKENQELKGTFQRILSKAQEQAEAEAQKAAAPSFDENPLEALKYQNEQLKAKFEKIEQTETQKAQYETQQREFEVKQREFISTYRSKAMEFAKVTPDFNDAYQHLLKSRKEEHELAGYDEEQVNQLLIEDEAAIVANALNKGQNPAETLYKMAKLRGYTQRSNVNDQEKKIASNEEKIATLERGLRASKSVNSGGVNARDNLTLESVAQMNDDELDSIDWNKLMKMG